MRVAAVPLPFLPMRPGITRIESNYFQRRESRASRTGLGYFHRIGRIIALAVVIGKYFPQSIV